ncbi:MAG: PRC-barrel domain-containing protein [Alphaproteobacteria bacterium]|nr:PRC-barrel domain-containing protein [Alphaproteobacteria bacterium]
MIKRSLLLAALMLTGFFAEAAQAAEPTSPQNVFIQRQAADQQLARDFLIGAKVYNAENKIIGDVEDLILDEYNRVVGVIIGVGGVLGLGEKRIGVRYTALKIEEKEGSQAVVLHEATKEKLKELQPFERAKPPKSFFDRAMEKAKELAAKTTDTTSDAYVKAKEKVGPAYEAAKEKASEAYQAAKDKVQETVDRANQPAKPQQ